ncbi:MAG: hypothetical protein IPI85_13175 [Dehalococcoidia bacterium]|nr:hypothetical protein [Dehalococcoidia bacterium]
MSWVDVKGLQDRDVNELPLASAGPGIESRQRGDCRLGSPVEVCLWEGELIGRPVGISVRKHEAAHRPKDQVAGPVTFIHVRPRLAERCDRHQDEAAIQLLQLGIAKPQPVHVPRLEGLDDDIGAFGQALEQRPPGGSLDIESDAALVGVVGRPVEALLRLGLVMVVRAETPPGIATGAFYLDDVGAHVGEDLSAQKALLIGEIEDPVWREQALADSLLGHGQQSPGSSICMSSSRVPGRTPCDFGEMSTRSQAATVISALSSPANAPSRQTI